MSDKLARIEALPGQRFGRLTVLNGKQCRNQHAYVLCACDCGREKWIGLDNLMGRRTNSCGCLRSEKSREHCLAMTSHGEAAARSPEYRCWIGMRKRCLDPSNDRFADYGGRGIHICDRWKDSFVNFLSDMGRKPTRTHSLERRDNNGNYDPSNCCWALPVQQSNNRRSNVNLTYLGLTFTATQWAEFFGVNADLFHKRIAAGWSDERTLTTIPKRRRLN